MCGGRLTVRQLLDEVLPPRSDLLLDLAQQYFQGDDKATSRSECLARAEQALGQSSLPQDQLFYVAATIHRLQNKPEQALADYRDAVGMNSRQPAWRYEFARLLLEQRQFDEAYLHARFLVRAQPHVAAYQQLLTDVNAQRLRGSSRALVDLRHIPWIAPVCQTWVGAPGPGQGVEAAEH